MDDFPEPHMDDNEPAYVKTNWGGMRLGLALTVAFYACVAAAVIAVRSCQ